MLAVACPILRLIIQADHSGHLRSLELHSRLRQILETTGKELRTKSRWVARKKLYLVDSYLHLAFAVSQASASSIFSADLRNAAYRHRWLTPVSRMRHDLSVSAVRLARSNPLVQAERGFDLWLYIATPAQHDLRLRLKSYAIETAVKCICNRVDTGCMSKDRAYSKDTVDKTVYIWDPCLKGRVFLLHSECEMLMSMGNWALQRGTPVSWNHTVRTRSMWWFTCMHFVVCDIQAWVHAECAREAYQGQMQWEVDLERLPGLVSLHPQTLCPET